MDAGKDGPFEGDREDAQRKGRTGGREGRRKREGGRGGRRTWCM
jgi:hypothetical protein